MPTLSSRKEKILQAVVEDYINSATPISSSEIQSKHLPALSSATIRNELAALEEMGFLYQPHTSAGRVPTSDAYKMYVEKLMPKRKLTRGELKIIKSHFNKQMIEMKDVLKKTAKVISEITNYTSVAFVNDITEAAIENIKIIKLHASTALVVIVTNMGVLKDTTVQLDAEFTDDYFDSVSKFALSVFQGRKIRDIMKPKKVIKIAIKEYKVFFDSIIDILKSYSDKIGVDDLVLEGTSKILEYPEYSNIAKAKAMLSVLEAKDQLFPILKRNEDVQLNINIGGDNMSGGGETFQDCAIVTANYSINGKNVGQAGVIGPIRMDYSKVISVLDYIGKTLNLLPAPESKERLLLKKGVEDTDDDGQEEEE